MKTTDKLSSKRFIFSLLTGLVFLAGTAGLFIIHDCLAESLIYLAIIAISFIIVLFLAITKDRMEDKLPSHFFNNYNKLFFVSLISFGIVFLSNYFKLEMLLPVMLIVFLFDIIIGDKYALAISLYIVCIYSVAIEASTAMVICSVMLALYGWIISAFIIRKPFFKRFLGQIIAFCVNIILPVICHLFFYLEVDTNSFFYILINAIIVFVGVEILVIPTKQSIIKQEEYIYSLYLEPGYDLYEYIKNFSPLEYQHATRVSSLSALCAKAINADVNLSRCGGYYYRLGKLSGDDAALKAVTIANNHCFPEPLIGILGESSGSDALPSTRESAIIHMVDAVITKIEVFDQDSMGSDWNQNMVIYQTINEFSQKGYYDNSGLTMNQLLIIRDCIVKEK